jgi:hypothetical protein
MDSHDGEYEPAEISHGTIAERVARLEQWMRDHIRHANRGFARNDETHREMLDGMTQFKKEFTTEVAIIKNHLDEQDRLFTRYNWLARGVMLGLFFMGAFGGAIFNREGWKLFIQLFR